MILSVVSFGWIFITTFLLGYAVMKLLLGNAGVKYDIDLVLVTGLMAATVYAEAVSVFGPVNLGASVGLGITSMIIFGMMRKEIISYMRSTVKEKRIWAYFALIVVLGAGGVISSFAPTVYDTGLYHAQAVRWINEYGCVKGLGNLHNRFAYNSSFLCLQALYNWKFLGEQLHSMNAYISVLMIGYAFLSFKFFRQRNEVMGDVMSLAVILYTGCAVYTVSSPNTDYFAMVLVGYIISKWFRCRSDEQRSVLCLLGIFCATVKLSTSMMVILSVPVFMKLARDRKWKFISVWGVAGCITVSVFLIRNIIISGYILYPYAQLDFFHVDWKMPKELVVFDHNEIIVWGRNLNDVRKYDWGIESWFPIWWETLTKAQMFLCVMNIVCFIILGAECIICYAKHKNKEWILIWITSIFCLSAWLFSAPLIRYGRIYLYFQPLILLGIVIENAKKIIIRWIGMLCSVHVFCFFDRRIHFK